MGYRMHACVCGWMDFADVPEIAVFHFVFRGKMMAFELLSWWNPKWWIYHITDFGSNDVFVWRPLFASFLVLSWLLCRLCNLQASYAVECLCMFNFLLSNLCGVFFSNKEEIHVFVSKELPDSNNDMDGAPMFVTVFLSFVSGTAVFFLCVHFRLCIFLSYLNGHPKGFPDFYCNPSASRYH